MVKKAFKLHKRRRPYSPIPSARVGNKGISNLIGMIFVLMIFALALTLTFLWVQNTSVYEQAVMNEMNFENQRGAEMLNVTSTIDPLTNNSTLTVINPTTHLIVITQVWNSSHSMVWNGYYPYAEFSNKPFPQQFPSSDGHLKVVTEKGSIFYSTPTILAPPISFGIWNVTFWVKSPSGSPIILGTAIWHDLSFSRVYGNSITWGAQYSDLTYGFNATAYITPSADNFNATIGLFTPFESGTSQMNITLSGTTFGSKIPSPPLYDLTSSTLTSCPFSNLDANQSYLMQLSYVNSAISRFPQTVSLSIEGADFT